VGNDGPGLSALNNVVDHNKEVCGTGRIGGILQHFRKRKPALRQGAGQASQNADATNAISYTSAVNGPIRI